MPPPSSAGCLDVYNLKAISTPPLPSATSAPPPATPSPSPAAASTPPPAAAASALPAAASSPLPAAAASTLPAASLSALRPASLSVPPLPLTTVPNFPPLKGAAFFASRKAHVLNFVSDPDAVWKVLFRGSEVLSGKRKDKVGINLVILGQLATWTLASADSEYEPGYRLELNVNKDTASALRVLFDTGPFEDTDDDIRYPLLGCSATFSAKLRTLQKKECPSLSINDPFPFLWHGTELDGSGTPLQIFPAAELTVGSSVAVETNISSYSIPPRGQFPGRKGYSMSLRTIYVFPATHTNSSEIAESSPGNRKRPGDGLVSPRKNKQAGQPAVFSDDD